MNLRKKTAGLLATGVVLAGTALTSAIPVQAAASAEASINAVEPTLSVDADVPVGIKWVSRYSETPCSSGQLCLSVKDPTKGTDKYWKVYQLSACNVIYKIYNWEGGGFWVNKQTDDAYGTFYAGDNGNGTYTHTAPSPPTISGEYGWTPINSVRACIE